MLTTNDGCSINGNCLGGLIPSRVLPLALQSVAFYASTRCWSQMPKKLSVRGKMIPEKVALRSTNFGELSPRELDVLAFVVAGLDNNELATALGISRRTVEHHRMKIHTKLRTRNTAELVCVALLRELNKLEGAVGRATRQGVDAT